MRTLFFTLTMLCISLGSTFAQINYSVKGAVQDTTTAGGLVNTSVVVLNSKDSTLVKYVWAGENGNFLINNLREGNFILLVSYPDFADYVQHFSLSPDKSTIDFGKIKLILKARLLEEVIVRGKVAEMTIKGDTTEFNADAFTIEANSKVEDLLKQLPGIQVDQDGKITAQGKTVNKVLVDGEEFFGDDPTLVTKNIRGDMVDKVQLYDKKSDQATFTGIDDGERTKTLNIKLKEDKKQGYFGKFEGGAGNDDYYQGQAMFNYFKNKSKVAAYGTSSNTAKAGLGGADNNKYAASGNIQMIEGGFMVSGGVSDELDRGTFSGQGIPLTHNGGFHYDTKWKADKYSLNMNFKAGTVTVNGANNRINQNNLPTGLINSLSARDFERTFSRQKLDAVFTVKLDTTSDLKISVDGALRSQQALHDFLTSSTRSDGSAITGSERTLNNNYDQQMFNATVFWSKKLKKKGRTLSVSLGQSVYEQNTNDYVNSVNRFFNRQGTLDSTTYVDQYKPEDIVTSGFNTNLTYSEPLSKTFSVIFNYGLNISESSADRRSFNQSASGVYDIFDREFSNNFELKQTSNQAGAIFNYRKNKTVINFGTRTSAVDFKQTNLYTNSVFDRKFINWMPQGSYQYNFSQQKSLSVRYSGYSRQPSLSQIQPIRVNSDPLNVAIGNPDLRPYFQNNFDVFYNSYKVLTDKSIFLSGSYTITSNAIVSNTVTDVAGKSTFQTVNLRDKQPTNFYLYGSWSKKISGTDIRMGLGINASGSTYFNRTNDVLNKTRSNRYGPSISIYQNKPKKFSYNINIGPTYNTNESSLQRLVNDNGWGVNSALNFTVELPGKTKIISDLRYQYTEKTQSFSENFNRTLWNTSIVKNLLKDNTLQVLLSGNDILNQNIGFSRSASSNIISQDSYTTIRRYFMISAIYDLSRMGGPKPANKAP